MPRILPWMLWCSAVLACAEDAWAEWPLFRNADEAQRHCPIDSVVWLDLQRNTYYVPGQRRYGHGATGAFACREEAPGREPPLRARTAVIVVILHSIPAARPHLQISAGGLPCGHRAVGASGSQHSNFQGFCPGIFRVFYDTNAPIIL
jgi:hypothetical protein